MNEIIELKNLLKEAQDALRANQVFHTPIALRQNGKEWNEYQIDAINRTREVLSKINY